MLFTNESIVYWELDSFDFVLSLYSITSILFLLMKKLSTHLPLKMVSAFEKEKNRINKKIYLDIYLTFLITCIIFSKATDENLKIITIKNKEEMIFAAVNVNIFNLSKVVRKTHY